MSKVFRDEDKSLSKINSMYGLTYFVLSIWVFCASIVMIVLAFVYREINFSYGIAGIGIAYCATLLVCEIFRNRKEKDAPEVSKKTICDYLSSNFNFVKSSHRAYYTKPGKGRTKGLPLADTHYIVNGKERKCFMYVYENYEKEVTVLLKVNVEQFSKIKKAHPSAFVSNFPKVSSGDSYCRLLIDSTYSSEQLFEIIKEAIGNITK